MAQGVAPKNLFIAWRVCWRVLLWAVSHTPELGLVIWIKVFGYNCVTQRLVCACLSDVGFCMVFVSLFFPLQRNYIFSLSPVFFFCHSRRSDGTQHTFRKHLLVVRSWDKQSRYVTLHKIFGTDIYLWLLPANGIGITCSLVMEVGILHLRPTLQFKNNSALYQGWC